MIQRGIVKSVSEGMAQVEVGGGEGCNACNSKESCMSLSGKRPEAKVISVENTLGAEEGDAVQLELPVSATVKIISITFIVPVLLLITGYWILMPAGSTQGALGAVGGLVIGMMIALFANRALGRKKEYRMRMTDIVEKNCQETEVLN